tara:strand:+ start:475 stop:864 length:390 start_codon:yes stop_codon:yes gene_type:complete
MAYISQEEKKELTPAIKAVLNKYGVKGTISINHYSTLVVKLKSGDLDLDALHQGQSLYAGETLSFTHGPKGNVWLGEAGTFLSELNDAMKGPKWFDHSDSMTDYFHLAHYTDIKFGDYKKPYVYTGAAA